MTDAGRDLERMRDYLGGRLSDDEHRAFEERLVRDPELTRELERTLRLREGLEQVRAEGSLNNGPSRRRVLRTRLPALAAALVAGVALFLWVHSRPAPLLTASSEPRTAGAAPSIVARFTFVATREVTTPDLELPSSGLIELRAAPGLRTTGSPYRLTLTYHDDSGAATPVGTVAGLALSADGYIHGYADAARLGPGGYVLSVESDPQSAAAPETFRFNLRPRQAR